MSVYTGGMSNHALIERIQQAALRRQASMIDISSLQEMLEMHPTDAAHHDMKHETGSTTELLVCESHGLYDSRMICSLFVKGDHSQLHSQESIPMPIVRSLSAISLQALGQHDARKRNESMASIRRAESTASLHKHVHLAEPEPEFTVFPPGTRSASLFHVCHMNIFFLCAVHSVEEFGCYFCFHCCIISDN